jgi:hypothetical protein
MNETPTPVQAGPAGDKGSILHQLEMWLNEYLGQKAPKIPQRGREAIVKIAPWITLIILIIALPVILALFGLSAFLAPFAFLGGFHAGAMFIVTWVLTLITFVLEIIALPGLFHRKRKGWLFLFYSSLIGAVLNIISLHISGLIGTVIGLYLLFQIRDYYK